MLFLVNDPEYQERYVRPYTLFPSAGRRTAENELFPQANETEAEWRERMRESAPMRRRAREIYDRLRRERGVGGVGGDGMGGDESTADADLK